MITFQFDDKDIYLYFVTNSNSLILIKVTSNVLYVGNRFSLIEFQGNFYIISFRGKQMIKLFHKNNFVFSMSVDLEQRWSNFSPEGPQSQILTFREPHSKLPRLFQNYISTQ